MMNIKWTSREFDYRMIEQIQKMKQNTLDILQNKFAK